MGIDSGEIHVFSEFRTGLSHIVSQYLNDSLGRFKNAKDHIDRCCFARPIGAEKPDDFTGAYGKGNMIDGRKGAELFCQIFYLQYFSISHGRPNYTAGCR
jgi:hypothetical protein